MTEETRSTVLRLLIAALNLYAGGLVAAAVLRLLLGDRLWPVALVMTFYLWLALPCLLIAPLMAWLKEPVGVGLAGASLLIGVLLFGALLLPSPRPEPAAGIPLRVLTYNVSVNAADVDAIIALLRDSDADIVAIQELGSIPAAAIEDELSDLYPHQALEPGSVQGRGVISRYPITEYDVFYTEPPSNMPQMTATLDIDGREVRIVNAHPPRPGLGGGITNLYDDSRTVEQVVTLGPSLREADIALGDFNSTSRSDTYDFVRSLGLRDAFREVGWGLGLTFPARSGLGESFPPRLIRIDYIFVAEGVQVLDAWVGDDASSDHMPLLADLILVDGEE